MNTYIFKTKATMKYYNNEKYWIDRDYIKDRKIFADDVEQALKLYVDDVNKEYYNIISKNAVKNREPMYKDVCKEEHQIGYIITAKTIFPYDDRTGYSEQYFELWIEIIQAINPFE